MGKSRGKLKRKIFNHDCWGNEIPEERITKREFVASNHRKVLSKVPDKVLLEIGGYVSKTDFAVRFYNNKKHPQFYKNRELLEKSIRRSYGMGAFNHRETIIDYLEDYVDEKEMGYDE